MFTLKASTKPTGTDVVSARARNAGASVAQSAQSAQAAAQQAQAAAQAAAQQAQTAAQAAAQQAQAAAQSASSAAHTAAEEVRQRVQSARGWAAPRLENAADYTTTTVAPRVSGALRTAAQQVSPDDSGGRRGVRSVVAWSVLGVAVLAGAGAAAAVIRSRYKAAMAADTNAMAGGDPREPGGANSPADPASLVNDQDAGVGVNGQAPSSGW